MSRADLLQQYIDDLNEIANLCENEPERDEGLAAECFGVIYAICEMRIKELDKLRIKQAAKTPKAMSWPNDFAGAHQKEGVM